MHVQPDRQPLSIARLLSWIAAGFLALCLLTYAADWAVWRLRGAPVRQMEVTRVSVATLKANKEEYYFEGTDTAPCVQTWLPQMVAHSWSTPCWWLARHRQQILRY